MKTNPEPLSDDVPASLKEITVTFNRKMMDGSWSWTGGGDTFPKTTGKPRYDRDCRTCSLPVQLEHGKVYWVGINSPSNRHFQTPEHIPAKWHVILFATAKADGSPTPIPDEMTAKVKRIAARSR